MNVLALRERIAELLADEVGTYTFPQGATTDAIAVLPDPDYGYNYPPSGTQVNGLEVVIKPALVRGRPLIGAIQEQQKYQIQLRAWDATKTTATALQLLFIGLKDSYLLEAGPTVLPNSVLESVETVTLVATETLVHV